MNLQEFVTHTIEAAGGIVEPLEYALCQVMVPQECDSLLGGRTELLLAFNYDVAMENPEAEFITFGSSLLDGILEYTRAQTTVWTGTAVVDRPEAANAPDKIERFLEGQMDLLRCHVKVLGQESLYGIYIFFQYACRFATDEPFTEDIGIWYDMTAGELCEDMGKTTIFFEEGIPRDHPVVMSEAASMLDIVTEECGRKAQDILNRLGCSGILEKETARIIGYYDELYAENQKRLSRKGITPEHRDDILSKAAAIELEGKRQLAEITEKYNYAFDLHLARTSVYFVPITRYKVQIVSTRESQQLLVFYNPILRGFGILR